MIILIGSYPIINFYEFDLGRSPQDIDVVMMKSDFAQLRDTYPDFNAVDSKINPGKFKIAIPSIGLRMEADVTESESSTYLQGIVDETNPQMDVHGIKMTVPPFIYLCAIKRSHVMFPVNAKKNLADWYKLHSFFNLTDYWNHAGPMKLYELRHVEALERNKARLARINLNKPNEVFFKPAQNLREFDHDALHRIVAYHDKPLFESCKHDMTKAKIDRDLFETLPFIDQIRMVKEECMVIGYERFYKEGRSYQDVYNDGFCKFVTELCKGWFQEFALENIDQTYHADYDFVKAIEIMKDMTGIERVAS